MSTDHKHLLDRHYFILLPADQSAMLRS